MLKVITSVHLSNFNTHTQLLNSININEFWQQLSYKTFTVRPPVQSFLRTSFYRFFARYLYPFFEGWPLIDRETTEKSCAVICVDHGHVVGIQHMCADDIIDGTCSCQVECWLGVKWQNSDTIRQWHQEQDDVLQIREPGEPPLDPLRQSGFRWAQIRSLSLLPEDFHDAHAESQWRR